MRVVVRSFAFLLTLLLAGLAQAGNYTKMYVFGDSLSDAGNLKAVLQDPNIPQRFTNGPVAVEVIASVLGLPLTNSYHLLGGALPFGNNYAIAGARAIDEDGNEATPDINLPTQVNAFLQIHRGQAPQDALYIVMIGGNDIRDAREIRIENIYASGTERQELVEDSRDSIALSVESEAAQIRKLIAAGARNILVVNAPDIGKIPETLLKSQALQAAAPDERARNKAAKLPKIATNLTKRYNRELRQAIKRIEQEMNIDVMEFDLRRFNDEQIENAAALGFTNTTAPCIYVFTQGGTPNAECVATAPNFPFVTTFYFWDEIHPTARAHYNAAMGLLEKVLAH